MGDGKRIYISFETDSDERKVKLLQVLLVSLSNLHPEHTFISGSESLSYLRGNLSDGFIIRNHLRLLDLCDELWTFSHYSHGHICDEEFMYARRYNIPIVEKMHR